MREQTTEKGWNLPSNVLRMFINDLNSKGYWVSKCELRAYIIFPFYTVILFFFIIETTGNGSWNTQFSYSVFWNH